MSGIALQPLELVLGITAALTLGGFLGFFLRAWVEDRQQARRKRALEDLLGASRSERRLFVPSRRRARPPAPVPEAETGSTWRSDARPIPDPGFDAAAARAPVVQPGPDRAGADAGDRAAITILIVDDRLELRAVHTAFLESHGYRVLEAGDGDTALDTARRYHPDAILLDHSLPKRTGLQVARELKSDSDTAGIPIVFMTAHSYGAVGRSAIAAGCAAFLPKPCEPSRVLREIMRHAPIPPASRA